MEGSTVPETLAGARFWIPLIFLSTLAAATIFFIGQGNGVGGSVASPQTAPELSPRVARLVRSLEERGVICGNLSPLHGGAARCQLNGSREPTEIRSFESRAALHNWVAAAESKAGEALRAHGMTSYIITGPTWSVYGTWSETRDLGAGAVYAETAQDVHDSLGGCLEIVPQETGSC